LRPEFKVLKAARAGYYYFCGYHYYAAGNVLLKVAAPRKSAENLEQSRSIRAHSFVHFPTVLATTEYLSGLADHIVDDVAGGLDFVYKSR
jgi:hypothetical protein